MLILDNQTDFTCKRSYLEKIADFLTDKDIELLLVDDESIRSLNAQHRNKNASTDVLSFPLIDMPHSPLGAIVISVDTAKRVSEELQHSLHDEVALLFIHGLLHLLGFDHEKDDGQMRKEEQKIIEKFHLPKSLIIRTEK